MKRRPFPWKHAVATADAEALLKQFSTNRPGMYPIGSRARKCSGEPGDIHTIGDVCTIAGVVPKAFIPERPEFPGAYFVVWDDIPDNVGFIIASKIVAIT